jgi:ArsR family transcriptional regulator
MLELAREHAAELSNIEFVRGSTDRLLVRQVRADVVIINMVLHHTPDPQRIVSEAAALLNNGGKLIVSELCAHDQIWAREHCGDLWLGFQHEELERWANHAGLELTASVFLAQRNGFQAQVQQFNRT